MLGLVGGVIGVFRPGDAIANRLAYRFFETDGASFVDFFSYHPGSIGFHSVCASRFQSSPRFIQPHAPPPIGPALLTRLEKNRTGAPIADAFRFTAHTRGFSPVDQTMRKRKPFKRFHFPFSTPSPV